MVMRQRSPSLRFRYQALHQPAGAAAYDCEIKHISSVVSGPAPVTGHRKWSRWRCAAEMMVHP